MSRLGFWLSDASAPSAEIGSALGFEFVVLDVEHGTFDLATLERFVPVLRGLQLEVFAKVLCADRGPIQQALDFGCSGVIVPHVRDSTHAARVCGYAKFPPLGERSLAGGRTANYGGISDQWISQQDAATRCYPLIEDGSAVDEIEQIVALDTVDGIQIGPSDLSTSRGRGAYAQTEQDWADIERCVEAVTAAGKPWLFPAWTPAEQEWAVERQADHILVCTQYSALSSGFRQAKEAIDVLTAIRSNQARGSQE